MESQIAQLNSEIEDTYIRAYKLILNINDIPSNEDKCLTANKMQEAMKAKAYFGESIAALKKEKHEVSQEIKILTEKNNKHLKELSTISKELKNSEVKIEDTMANFDWEKCKKSINTKKFGPTFMIPVLAIMFNRLLTGEEIAILLKQKYFPASVASRVLTFNVNFHDVIKQHLAEPKIPNDEMYGNVTTLNQLICQHLEYKANHAKIESEKLINRANCTNKEAHLKVINELLVTCKSQVDEKITNIAKKITDQIEGYNKAMKSKSAKSDLVAIYYNRLMGTIEKEREALLQPLPQISEAKQSIKECISVEQERPLLKKKGIISSLFGCC